jgi:membrane protease YdiL (CAAX protease family)
VAVMFGTASALLTWTEPGESLSGDVNFPGWTMFLGTMAMLLVLVPLQASAEEYVFRGWMLQAVGAFMRNPWPAILFQAVLFAAAHGWGTAWGFGGLVVTGTIAGVLAIRTGGLEAYIALHTMNNLVAFGLAAASGSLDDDSTAADMPWQLTIAAVLMDLLFAAAVLYLARRRKLQTEAVPLTVGGPAPQPGPAAQPVPASQPGPAPQPIPAPFAGTAPLQRPAPLPGEAPVPSAEPLPVRVPGG